MPKVMIVYASLTGNTEQCAEIVEQTFRELGAEVELVESYSADPTDFEDVDIAIVGTYTYGTDANLPDEIVDFYEELEELDLSGKIYGTFGSGDTFYEKYCKSVDDFSEQFDKTGAVKGAESVKVDLDPEEEDTKNLQAFAKSLLDTFNNQ
ncbi:flavodoxin [Marinilactibacillus psychrotolerans]|uniref:Flavodoxin n=2 Tax=Marinilactibacillus psychrotolerans TaxID=191770 RepID=A0AAV3WSV0_9LACT|nr:flavodoxin [Marinilactibacillus psychrotolerans]GEL67993.1 flavodoxin [Marinilactibacillus psychrotolerans]GEQ36576.1 flavodoxin [Marinilactibacillus psychrotolerans]SDD31175.1 flavodoxin, short chain [Marinilactibacillus psychrotolerans]